MIVKCNCQHCNGHIEFDPDGFQPGTRAPCPHCRMETLLFIPPPTPKPATPDPTWADASSERVATLLQAARKLQTLILSPSGAVDRASKSRVTTYLAFIRANSSYALLRRTIDVLFGLSAVAVCVFSIGFFVFAAVSHPLGILFALLQSFLCIFLCFLVLALLFAFRQSAFLLIDLSDTLLHEHSKNEPKRKP